MNILNIYQIHIKQVSCLEQVCFRNLFLYKLARNKSPKTIIENIKISVIKAVKYQSKITN